ncbi:MAG TPA: hypothetical protein VLA04_00470 [Verrucomicrobiae bacterium]|nr:hypothetical protein [Verrucomicrobiae bacterium]
MDLLEHATHVLPNYCTVSEEGIILMDWHPRRTAMMHCSYAKYGVVGDWHWRSDHFSLYEWHVLLGVVGRPVKDVAEDIQAIYGGWVKNDEYQSPN